MESEFQNIPLNNETLTFYYDETGNCGKFILTEDGFNDNRAVANDFILGGIMHEGTVCSADTDKLLGDLRLNPGTKELKFDKIQKGFPKKKSANEMALFFLLCNLKTIQHLSEKLQNKFAFSLALHYFCRS